MAELTPSTWGEQRWRSHSVEETMWLGQCFAAAAEPGDRLLLVGGLGAGKTAFVQGVARGLGVADHVTSPTFVLAQAYEGRIRLLHLDLYRLEPGTDLTFLDLEASETDILTVIEWADRAPTLLPEDSLWCGLTAPREPLLPACGEGGRDVTAEATGPRSDALLRRWRRATETTVR